MFKSFLDDDAEFIQFVDLYFDIHGHVHNLKLNLCCKYLDFYAYMYIRRDLKKKPQRFNIIN